MYVYNLSRPTFFRICLVVFAWRLTDRLYNVVQNKSGKKNDKSLYIIVQKEFKRCSVMVYSEVQEP